MGSGRYAHINDWSENFAAYLKSIDLKKKSNVLVHINVWWLPLFEDARKKDFLCGCVHMTQKSNKIPNVNEFRHKFVSEMEDLLDHGIDVDGVTVKINAVVCDAPARWDFKNIVNHNAYHSWERCEQKGEYHGGHVALTKMTSKLRTDESFLK